MAGHESMRDTMTEAVGARRYLDLIVGFRVIAAIGALIAAITPAVVATEGGATLLGSVSAYWDVGSDWFFEVPLTAAAILLFLDGLLSYISPNRDDFGRRWYNVVLGAALFVLTWWNLDDDPAPHYIAAWTFFVLFILIIAYTTALGWWGRHIPGFDHDDEDERRDSERSGAQVAAVFFGLLILTLVAHWPLGLVSFFFFEVFALVNFALFYVQGFVRPFPFRHFEFPIDWLNSLLRAIRVMPTP